MNHSGSMYRAIRHLYRLVCPAVAVLSLVLLSPPTIVMAFDTTRYMSPDDVRPGMKGIGRTVIAGTRIDAFNFEVISVMKNAWFAKQDIILVRCSGLNLEHTGIIGGMSGSPCYVRDETGRERMIGAVAFGWSLSKDPVCGLQPITQMLPIAEVRDPGKRPKPATAPTTAPSEATRPQSSAGLSIGEFLAQSSVRPVDAGSRFSVFNEEIELYARPADHTPIPADQLRPLAVPVMVTGANPDRLARLSERFEPLGLTLLASGSPATATAAAMDNVTIEPGSVLCVPLLTGDLQMEALGTCTEVTGSKIFGFGHSLVGRGWIEMPLATGMVHTVIASIMRSNKLGAALKPVGTLWGDESSGIFGTIGPSPATTQLEVRIHDARGNRNYHYNAVRDREVAASLLTTAVEESIYAHSSLPQDHTVKYHIEVEFEGLGTFTTTNFTSHAGTMGVSTDFAFPILALTNTPFGDTRVKQAKAEVIIESGVRRARIEKAQMPRTTYKPGEKVTVRIQWFHLRSQPTYTEATYDLKLPADIPDGEYQLVVGGVQAHLGALKMEKPHWWRIETLPDALAAMNLAGSFSEDRLYLHLTLTDGGLAVGRTEMPELPSFRQKIIADAKRNDVQPYQQSISTEYETGFVVDGSQSFKLRISRKNEY